MKNLIFLFFIALSTLKVSAQSILLTPGNQTTTNSNPDLILRSTGTPDIRSIKSEGTIASPSPILNGSLLLRIRGAGFWNTSNFSDQVGIDMFATENWGVSNSGADMRFSTTSNGSIFPTERMRINHNGNIGIGTTAPAAKLDVANSSTSSSNASLRLLHSSSTGFNRLNFENVGRTGSWLMSANVGSGPADSRWNLFHSTTGDILSVTGDGKVGIGISDPILAFHVNTSAPSVNSSTGAAAIGLLNSTHLIFDNNEINAYNGTNGTTLFLNEESNGTVVIGGSGASASDLRVNGFTQLGGSAAPSIKMKKLTGTTSSTAAGIVNIPHGISSSAKILAVDIHVNFSTSSWVGPNYQTGSSSVGYLYTYDDTNITVRNDLAPNSNAILGKPITILLTYEE